MRISKPGIPQPQQQPIKGHQQPGSFSEYFITVLLCTVLFLHFFKSLQSQIFFWGFNITLISSGEIT